MIKKNNINNIYMTVFGDFGWEAMRKIGTLFGQNPFTMGVARDAERSKTEIAQREKKAGIGRNFGTSYNTETFKEDFKKLENQRPGEPNPLQMGGKKYKQKEGGRRSMNKANGEKKFDIKKSQTCNQDNC